MILFNTFPLLPKNKAFEILSSPIDRLKSPSDFYKAVSHLENYPDNETENYLICFLQYKSQEESVRIAKRKALEVLARLGCRRAILPISNFLGDDDPFMVENAVWALQKLDCQDERLLNLIFILLDDSNQNRRVIIQALSNLGYKKALLKIKHISYQRYNPNSVLGAAIAAVNKLGNKKFRINELKTLLENSNQNDRQTAIQDVIDANAIELLPFVIRTPVSPFFRIRAVNKLCPINENNLLEEKLLETIDLIIRDEPRHINTSGVDKNNDSVDFLINQLFSTDFNRCYFAMKKLVYLSSLKLFPCLYKYLPKMQKDYGSLYFLLKIFELGPFIDKEFLSISLKIIRNSIDSSWPEFMKFSPAAILALIKLNPLDCEEYIFRYLDSRITPYWVCRYSVLMGIDKYLSLNQKINFIDNIENLKSDKNKIVSLKAIAISRAIKSALI